MFDNVIGHEKVKEKLENDIKNDTLSHAYLFTGPDGIGKKQLALEFARLILGTDKLYTCVDFKLVQKQPDKKEILVEQVRQNIVNDVYIAPATNKHKVYIIDDAHLLNINSQNTLLKTIEEPPQHVVIILITSDETALLTTVISRVKRIKFNRLEDSQIISKLSECGKTISEDKLEYANGSMKLALELSEEENVTKYDKVIELYKSLSKGDILVAMQIINDISFKDEDVLSYYEYLLDRDKKYDKIKLVEDAKRRMTQNANEDIVKQAFCLKMNKKEV